MRRLFTFLRDAWLVLGLTLLLVLLADAALREWSGPARWPTVVADAEAPDRRSAPVYADYAPAASYWREHGTAKALRWEPYVYWRRKPHRGEAINVDGAGMRASWRPPVDGKLREVWVLGGSAVWGTGVADDDTVPSWLARLAAGGGEPLVVRNLGESGYVSGQSLALLQSRLREHPAPAAVLFLEGANDVFAALQGGVPGAPQNEGNRARDFRSTDGIEHYLEAFPRSLEGLRGLGAGAPPEIDETLVQTVATVFRENMRQARALLEPRGTVVIHAWQPTVFGRAVPTDHEAAVIAASYAAHRSLQRAVDAALAGETRLLVLTDLFDGSTEPAFLDALHLGSAANRRVAAALYEALRPSLARAAAGPDGV